MEFKPGDDAAVPCLMGPTGSGKTAVALALARRFPIEIVSVDSALVYRGLNIGSAKPTPFERAAVPHHLIDICDLPDHYSAARFSEDASRVIQEIRGRDRIPLLVGGTGLYFHALEQGLADLPASDKATRDALRSELEQKGNEAMHAELAAVDPEAAARIHPNDPQRLLRALEVYRLTGTAMSTLWRDNDVPGRKTTGTKTALSKFALNTAERSDLHANIERRFHAMLEQGFVNEVIGLRRQPGVHAGLPALRAVGYRAVWDFLDGRTDYAEMCERGIIATRQLAKRQITWLRGTDGVIWCSEGPNSAFERISRYLQQQTDFKTDSI